MSETRFFQPRPLTLDKTTNKYVSAGEYGFIFDKDSVTFTAFSDKENTRPYRAFAAKITEGVYVVAGAFRVTIILQKGDGFEVHQCNTPERPTPKAKK